MKNHDQFAAHVAKILTAGNDQWAIRVGNRDITWSQLENGVDRIIELLAGFDLKNGAPIGVLGRATAETVTALLGVLRSGHCLVTLNPIQETERLAREIVGLKLPVVIADTATLAEAPVLKALKEVGSAAIGIPEGDVGKATLFRELDRSKETDFATVPSGTCILMQSSGTTGKPKRIPLKYEAFLHAISGQLQTRTDTKAAVKTRPVIVALPLAHIGGIFHSVKAVLDGRPQILMSRFVAKDWADAVRDHRLGLGHLVPAAIKMIQDDNVPADHLKSLKAIICGTAPLRPDLQLAFEEKYGVPILVVYGATEFAGGVAGWSLDLHNEFMPQKVGSVGRARDGTELRVVDADSGQPLVSGEKGLLEVRSVQSSTDNRTWVRTTDIAVIDEDDFLWIQGRADAAINRGGFKILPAEIESVLMGHPGVSEAVVVGMDDDRLGQVPVAAITAKQNVKPPTENELEAHARKHLTRYMVPVAFRIVAELPRTDSMKPNLPAIKNLFSTMAKSA